MFDVTDGFIVVCSDGWTTGRFHVGRVAMWIVKVIGGGSKSVDLKFLEQIMWNCVRCQ